MVFSTTLRSSVELTARPTSPSAVRSRLRACTSSNSRAFSMAMTAWSAKVSTSSICLSVNGATAWRSGNENANRRALAQQRDAEHGPDSSVADASPMSSSRVRPERRDVNGRPLSTARPVTRPGSSSPGTLVRLRPRARRVTIVMAIKSNAHRRRSGRPALIRRCTESTAFEQIVSKTGWMSVGELR